jgi:hypothetical protein
LPDIQGIGLGQCGGFSAVVVDVDAGQGAECVVPGCRCNVILGGVDVM